ncbi:MAG: amino acid permease [Holophagales bacterium]|nr:amino acid permease [Holophagales bacterium]
MKAAPPSASPAVSNTEPAEGPDRRQTISLTTATSIAVANMIGTGVFTSLGFQLADVRSGFALLALWVIGGVFALCGALSYGELAAALPRSGGELNFLSRIYHPALGFLAGWISFVMGFALPIALAAMAFGSYFEAVAPGVHPLISSCAVVAVVTLAHLRDLHLGSWFQNLFTAFKIGIIVVFVGAAVLHEDKQAISFAPDAAAFADMASGPFAVSLLYVMFAYAGWNASTYIIEEVKTPERTVPRSLVLATLLVTVLYTGLNWAFLATAPAESMVGQIDVGHVSAAVIFGPEGGRLMSALLCLALVSTLSAMTWAGPRVTQVIGQDYAVFRPLARTNRHGIPVLAILVQSALVILLLATATFQALLVYTRFTLAISSAMTVLGVFVLRVRAPELPRPYRTWGYPWTPLIFLAVSLVTVVFTLLDRPVESIAGLLTVLLGLPIYFWSPRRPVERVSAPPPDTEE